MATPLYRWLDVNGDGTGNDNATGDYSSAAEEFYIEPAEGQVIEIHRMVVNIEDTAGFQAEEYGNLAAALTNGITVFYNSDDIATEVDLCDGVPIKTNAQWGATCFNVALKTWGAGDEVLLVRWTFSEAGQPITIRNRGPVAFGGVNAGTTAKFGVRLNDSFTGLIAHRFMIQGLVV